MWSGDHWHWEGLSGRRDGAVTFFSWPSGNSGSQVVLLSSTLELGELMEPARPSAEGEEAEGEGEAGAADGQVLPAAAGAPAGAAGLAGGAAGPGQGEGAGAGEQDAVDQPALQGRGRAHARGRAPGAGGPEAQREALLRGSAGGRRARPMWCRRCSRGGRTSGGRTCTRRRRPRPSGAWTRPARRARSCPRTWSGPAWHQGLQPGRPDLLPELGLPSHLVWPRPGARSVRSRLLGKGGLRGLR